MENDTSTLSARISKTCDRCKGRKVRCIIAPGQGACNGCLKRRAHCRFSHTKRLLRHIPEHVGEQTDARHKLQAQDCQRWSAVNGECWL